MGGRDTTPGPGATDPRAAPADVEIRAEDAADTAAIRMVHAQAFARDAEAALVEALRARGKVVLGLVALCEGRVVGHVLFSPVVIECGARTTPTLGLGPLAVLPAHQRRGIGRRLVEVGLARCRRDGHASAVVLGDPAYYGRFGFTPAARFGIRCRYDAPEDAFMAIELRADALCDGAGTARYEPEFDRV